MLPLPAHFKNRVVVTWGDEARTWLAQLPMIIATCRQKWGLTALSPGPDLSYNVVAFASRSDGKQVVLKLGVPNPELTTEMAGLQLSQGRNLVALVEADHELGALLLQRLIPCTPLSTVTDDDEATTIAAHLMGDLPLAPPAGSQATLDSV